MAVSLAKAYAFGWRQKKARRLPKAIYQHLHFKGVSRVKVINDISFVLNHYGDQVENDIFWAGLGSGWEATSIQIWIRIASKAQIVLDIGANSGIYALTAKAVNPSSTVIAIEPAPRTFARLVKNISSNGFQIIALCVAASSRAGKEIFYDTLTSHQYSASLEKKMLDGRNDLVSYPVETIRIEQYLANTSLTGFILAKIDAEGHEPHVLAGFGRLLVEAQIAFIVEILDEDSASRCEDIFDGLGYVFYEIIEGVGLFRIGNLRASSERNFLICSELISSIEQLGGGVAHDEINKVKN